MFRFSDRVTMTTSSSFPIQFYQVISFRSSLATFKFSKQTQIFRKEYLMEKIAAFSALQIGSAYKNIHSRVRSSFCKDHHSCINTTDPLTGRSELGAHRHVAVTEKRDGLKRQGKFYKTIKARSVPEKRI